MGILHCIALRFIVLHRYFRVFGGFFVFVFYKLKVCGNLASSKCISATLPTAFAHFESLCHILVILTIFRSFLLLYHGDLVIAAYKLTESSDDG